MGIGDTKHERKGKIRQETLERKHKQTCSDQPWKNKCIHEIEETKEPRNQAWRYEKHKREAKRHTQEDGASIHTHPITRDVRILHTLHHHVQAIQDASQASKIQHHTNQEEKRRTIRILDPCRCCQRTTRATHASRRGRTRPSTKTIERCCTTAFGRVNTPGCR